MPGLRDLKRRIRSIQSTRKITRAMQMVSAAKMRKAQNAVTSSRTYSALAWELILDLSSQINSNHPLLTSYPRAKKVGVVLLGTNRGFVGGLNSNLGPLLKNFNTPSVSPPILGGEEKKSPPSQGGVARSAEGVRTNHEIISEVVVYGKQAKTLAQRMRQPIMADFEKQERTITTEDVYPLAKYITDAYISGEYKSIVIVYNHFVSTLVQKPTVKQLLPFIPAVGASFSRPSMQAGGQRPAPTSDDGDFEELDSEYIFEPTPKNVLEHLIPRIVESQLYQAILESNASEHSARMVMMKNATEAAGDLISGLTLTYNQLRQNKITTELAEITAGKIALE